MTKELNWLGPMGLLLPIRQPADGFAMTLQIRLSCYGIKQYLKKGTVIAIRQLADAQRETKQSPYPIYKIQ
jgi:hypothetical protein